MVTNDEKTIYMNIIAAKDEEIRFLNQRHDELEAELYMFKSHSS